MVACINHHLDVAKALVEAGADVDARTNDGETCLSLAARSGHEAVVEDLVSIHGEELWFQPRPECILNTIPAAS